MVHGGPRPRYRRAQRRSDAIAHVERAVARYTRDLALLSGRLIPIRANLDDLALLDLVASSPEPRTILNDRKLRVKTLEATLELLRESGQAGGWSDALKRSMED